MRQSLTTVLERNTEWQGDFATEPYETSWAGEAIFFVRVLSAEGVIDTTIARVQISPDGIHWCDEGSELNFPAENGVSCCRLSQFGGWLRIVGALPEGTAVKVIVYLALKE